MDFAEILKRVDRGLYDATDRSVLPRIARFMERGEGILGLLKSQNPALDGIPIQGIPMLASAFSHYTRWKEAYRNTRRILSESRLSLPDNSLARCAFPHELSAMERISRMCQRAGYADLTTWQEAVDAHLDLWNACLSLAEQNGLASSLLTAPGHPDAESFSGYMFRKTPIAEVKNYTWLGARRGQNAAILKIELDLPMADIQQQAAVYIPKMGTAAQHRKPETIVEELIGNNLESALLALMDYRAMDTAIQSARNAYMGLLSISPITADPIVGIYVGEPKSPMGLVCSNPTGDLLNSLELPGSESVFDNITTFLSTNPATTVIIPATAPDTDRLKELEDFLEQQNVSVIPILPSAIRTAISVHDLPRSVACALVLLHRAIRPEAEWGRIPAGKLGIGEFCSDLNEQQLEQVFMETRLLLRYQAKRGDTGLPSRQTRTIRAKRRLNPMVKTIRDLKPGMQIDGVVTNLTKFGAFVNIGLTIEAMIHVSQLSMEFVDEPSQIVSIGQTVSARILEVIPEKGRIALSLKPVDADHSRAPKESRELREAREHAVSIFGTPESEPTEAAGSPPKGKTDSGKISRSQALADLDALFKK